MFPPAAMQWDHLPGKIKLGDVSALHGRTRQEILAEIEKCELVCANCHTLRTAIRGGWARPTSINEQPGVYLGVTRSETWILSS